MPKPEPIGKWIDSLEKPNVDWLVEGMLPSGAVLMFFSEEGVGKSLLVADLAFAVASGQPWLGLSTKKGKVLYFDEENSKAVARERVYGLAKGRSLTSNDLSGELVLWLGALTAAAKEWPKFLLDTVAAEQPRLVVIDTLSALYSDGRGRGLENDNAYMKGMMMKLRNLIRAAAPQATLLLLHHDTKNPLTAGKPRGASSIAGDVDGYWTLTKSAGRPRKGKTLPIIIRPGKIRIIAQLPIAWRVTMENWDDGAIRLSGTMLDFGHTGGGGG